MQEPSLVYIVCSVFGALVISGLLVTTRINTQSIAAILGCLVGVCLHYTVQFTPGVFMYIWDPWNLLCIYYPIVILKLGFCTDYVIYRRAVFQIAIVIILGYPFSMFLTGCIISLVLPVDLDVLKIAIIGLIPTPIDVPDNSFKVEHMRILECLLNTEAILGNAFCFTILGLLFGVYDGYIVEWYQGVAYVIRDIVVAILFGFLIGNILKLPLKWFYNDIINVVSYLVCSVHIMFFICERVLFCSGTIAVFIVVLCFADKKTYLSRKTLAQVEIFLDGAFFLVVRIGYFVMFVKSTFRIAFNNRVSIIFESVSLYITATACRFLMYLIISPIISRIGHGFGFTSLITLFWAPKKGPVQLISSRLVYNHSSREFIGDLVFGYWFYFFLYSNIINVATVGLIMKKMGFLELSSLRRTNIVNCFKIVEDRRKNQMILLKMNRFYSGVNWPLVSVSTALVSSLMAEAELEKGDEIDVVLCPICANEIPAEMSKEDFIKMSREAKIRILKTEKVSFVFQFEEELINDDCVRKLLAACEAALGTDEPTIKLDDLLYVLRNKNLTGPLNMLQRRFLYNQEYFRMPLHRIYRRCYRLATYKWFEALFFFIIILNLIVNALVQIYAKPIHNGHFISIGLIHAFYIVYLIETLIKVYAHSYINTRRGFKNYWRFFWNRVDFVALVLNSVELVVMWVLVIIYINKDIRSISSYIGIVQYAKAIRLIRFFKILGMNFPRISNAFNRAVDNKLAAAYSMGTALVIGYEEALDTLSNITHNTNLRESLRAMLLADKSAITRELGNLNIEKPWVAIHLQTLQATSVILKSMNDALKELNIAGLVDPYEYRQLGKVLEKHRKNALNIERVNMLCPKTLLNEITWLNCDGLQETEMLELIEKMLLVKVWEAGEVICNEGQFIDGVCMLVTGLARSNYIPSENYIDDLMYNGRLPIKDYLRNRSFEDVEENFIMVGNSMGELSVLTDRPSSCKIVTEQPSQAFIIPREAMKEAMAISDDPVFGLECRMWKCITMNLVRRLLKTTAIYSTKTAMELNGILNRAFVPDLRCFKLFVVNKYIEDIVLLEGLVIDSTTRELITAPSYVPRNVHTMQLARDDDDAISRHKTKLMLIPVADADEYEVILRSEEISELVPDHSSVCLLTSKNIHKRPRALRGGVRSMYQAINSISLMRPME